MTIHRPDGSTVDIVVSDDSYRTRQIMGDDMLTLRTELEDVSAFPAGCWCEFQGCRYSMPRRANFVRKHSRLIEYTLLMHADNYRARTCAFIYCVGVYSNGRMTSDDGDGRLSFTLTATPLEHLQMVVDNLNKDLPEGETPYTVGNCIDGTEKLISYDECYCIDALQLQAETFETEYSFAGRAVSLGKVEYHKNTPLPMSYGMGNGFKPNTGCTVEGDTPPLERVYMQGGEQNIDPSTYAKTDTTPPSRTLLLPKNGAIWYDGTNFYADDYTPIPADARRYVVSERRNSVMRADRTVATTDGIFDATEIYPQRVGTVSNVVLVNSDKHFYDIVDDSIPSSLNYKDCLIEGETMTIIFQSGMLAGREFDVAYHHTASGSNAARRFEIVPAEQDGIMMPGDEYVPQVGDTYAVFHCQLPDAYFDDGQNEGAEWDAFRVVVKYLYDHEEVSFTFSGEVDGKWAKENWETVGEYMALGYHILFSDAELDEPIKLRVTGIKEFVNSPHKPQLTLSNALVKTDLGATMKRQQRNEPGGRFDPRIRWEQERLWGRTHRGLIGRVSVDAVYFDEDSAELTIGSKTFQMADPTLTPAKYVQMINSFQTISDKMVENGWLEKGSCDEYVCKADETLPILGTSQYYDRNSGEIISKP